MDYFATAVTTPSYPALTPKGSPGGSYFALPAHSARSPAGPHAAEAPLSHRPSKWHSMTSTTPKHSPALLAHDRPLSHAARPFRQPSGRSTPTLSYLASPMMSPGKHSLPSPDFSTAMPGPSPPKRFQSSSPPSADAGSVGSPSSPALARRWMGPQSPDKIRPLASRSTTKDNTVATTSSSSDSPGTVMNDGPAPLILVNADQLVKWVRSEDSHTLVLDMRSPTLNRKARVRGSVCISVPSTLLRRPMYGVDRIESSVDSPTERMRLARYRTALQDALAGEGEPTPGPSTRIRRIVVYDGDANLKGPLPATHQMALLLSKFLAANVKAELGHVVEGFAAICAVKGSEDILERSDNQSGVSDTATNSNERGSFSGRMSLALPAPSVSTPVNLRTSLRIDDERTPAPCATPLAPPLSFAGAGRLPQAAFTEASINKQGSASGAPSRPAKGKGLSLHKSDIQVPQAQQPTTDAVYGARGQESACANPFFDNIRQLSERLDLSRSLENVLPLSLPELTRADKQKLPCWIKELLDENPVQRSKRLAHEFYDLEAAEMRRLQEVMSWHTQSTDLDAGADQHPFSISAGVELGYKNRYKNIWPWEHARVRLTDVHVSGTDYVNASMIRLRGTRKQYIATQGPLQSTFSDFWQVVAQQDVGVVVMLTKQREDGREKCGDYLRSGVYGNISVKIEGKEGCGDEGSSSGDGGFFGFVDDSKPSGDETVVVKKVTLTRTDHPEWPSRHVRHVQYRSWPDFDVPPQADEVLDLIDVCNRQVEEVKGANSPGSVTNAEETTLGKGVGPILVHCSAGVGRTGSYIMIDALLDVMRQHRQVDYMTIASSPSEGTSLPTSSFTTSSSSTSLDLCRELTPATDMEDDDVTKLIQRGSKWMNIDSPCRSRNGSSSDDEGERNQIRPPVRTSIPDVIMNAPTVPDVSSNSMMNWLSHSASSNQVMTASPDLMSSKRNESQAMSIIEQEQYQPSQKSNKLPNHFETNWCDSKESETIPPLLQNHPVLPTVNEMREQRMSMVANYRQYVYVHEAILTGLMRELHITPVNPQQK